MAQRPAPLNMNKPSSAETQAKPNSARRHHSRTGQEALELFLASTVKLHPPPVPGHKPPFPKSIAHQKKDNDLKKNPAVIFSPPCSLIFNQRQGEKTCIQGTAGQSEPGIRGNTGGVLKSFRGETRDLESGCLFSEGSEVVMMIGSDVCLVAAAAASASRAAA